MQYLLCIIKGGAIDQYRSYATNFKKNEIAVSQRPVVTICPSTNEQYQTKYKYGVDFNISIGSIVAKLGNNSVKCSDFPSTEDGSDYYTYEFPFPALVASILMTLDWQKTLYPE